MENKIKQLRKGILELAILNSLVNESHYGYSLIKSLSWEGHIEITEGTIYPILGRLSKEGLVSSEWVESREGPPRKYYSITPKGEESFQVLSKEFNKLARLVTRTDKKPGNKPAEAGRKRISVKKEKKDGE